MTTPTDIIRNSIYSILNNVHTCMPGIIVSYDASTNKAIVQPALNKNFVAGEMEMPILENVPIIFPSSGNFNMSFPVNSGDYVLLLFSERSIDLWLNTGGQVTPNDRRKFDLSDAIAIPGLKPFNSDFSYNNGNDFSINFNGSSILIKPDGSVVINTSSTIAIGNTTTEVLDILSQLMQLLQGATVMGASFGGPLNPAFTAQVAIIQAQLDAIKGTIT